MIAQREMAVKTIAADEALWAVRRDLRRTPAEAVARLEAVDVEGLPSSLAAQVFGEWARARHASAANAASPSRSATRRDRVVAPSSLAMPGRGEYVVVTALGMGPAWKSARSSANGRCGAPAPLRYSADPNGRGRRQPPRAGEVLRPCMAQEGTRMDHLKPYDRATVGLWLRSHTQLMSEAGGNCLVDAATHAVLSRAAPPADPIRASCLLRHRRRGRPGPGRQPPAGRPRRSVLAGP